MKCPNCKHVSDKALLRCSQCSQVYDRDSLEAVQHLDYLVDWLARDTDEADQALLLKLRSDAVRERDALRETLGLPALAGAGATAPLSLPTPTHERSQPATAPAAARSLADATGRAAPATGVSQYPDASREAAAATAVSPLTGATRQAALLAAVRRHSQTWSGAMAGIEPAVIGRLQAQMESQAARLEGAASAPALPAEAPPMADILEFAIESLPRWATAAQLKVKDVDSILGYLRAWHQYAMTNASGAAAAVGSAGGA